MLNIIKELESNVSTYCKKFPVVFSKAVGHEIFNIEGTAYMDFLNGAGSLNYGYNNPVLKKSLLDYVAGDGITHSLDLYTASKAHFLENFSNIILKPRDLNYKVMFPGPTGTNAVEAALKLARKVRNTQAIIYCKNGYHGMTLGALSVTSNPKHRKVSEMSLVNTYQMPFVTEGGQLNFDIEAAIAALGIQDEPAAIILETIQCEGGVNVADSAWLRRLFQFAKEQKILTIVDDIQVGCGRTGKFFSFEHADLKPDLVCLSKSISGFGLPMSLLLINPDIDRFDPGEHNGTFRGNNLAFVTASSALCEYWSTPKFEEELRLKSQLLTQRLNNITMQYQDESVGYRGKGMIRGISFPLASTAGKVSQEAFKRKLIIETSGHQGEILKLLPFLTIPQDALNKGLDIIEESINFVMSHRE